MIGFGEFQLDPEERRLWRSGTEVKLAPKAMELLLYLAEHANAVVSKEDLFRALWPGTFVGDHALTVQIRELRKALGSEEIIETRHRRGYRFAPAAGGPPKPVAAPVPTPEPAAPAIPETHYARSGDVDIAYQVLGSGPVDIVFVMGWVSHLEYFWTEPRFARFLRRMASFSRLILFDKRGTGLSDRVPVDQLPTLEQRMDDVRAVMEAAGSTRAVIVGVSEGGPMSALFAATYPERTQALVMIGTYAKRIRDTTYPWGPTAEQRNRFIESIRDQWGGPVGIEERAPSLASDAAFRSWWATYLRMGASPSAAIALTRMNAAIDVRHVLEAVNVPALVIHRSEDRCLLVEEGRYVAQHIPRARFLELPGADHLPFVGDQEAILDEMESFIEGVSLEEQPESVLATVLCCEFIGAPVSGSRATLSEQTMQQIQWSRGVARPNDGGVVMATFDGPARALRCSTSLLRQATRMGYGVRAALHTGECDLLDGNRVGGRAVEIASLIQRRSTSGEILASSTVHDLVAGSGIHFAAAGTLATPQYGREWQLYRVLRAGGSE